MSTRRALRGWAAAGLVFVATTLLGYVATRMANAQEAPGARAQSSSLAVHAGAEVAVVMRAGRARVAAVGVARESGRVGDHIAVRFVPSGALVVVRVIGDGTVEVRL